jgi:hypothetical protein
VEEEVNGERERAAGIERGMGCVSLNERERVSGEMWRRRCHINGIRMLPLYAVF